MTEPAAGLRATLHQMVPIPLHAELTCGHGEMLALVGPSGSGKSTVLRCIGIVGKTVTLGSRVRVPVHVLGANDALLTTTVPRHLAESYALAEGRPLSLRLRGEQIHLMPPIIERLAGS